MYPTPYTCLLMRQRATVWGTLQCPLSSWLIWKDVEEGRKSQRWSVGVWGREWAAGAYQWTSKCAMLWPSSGKPFWLDTSCLWKYRSSSCLMDRKRGTWRLLAITASWSLELENKLIIYVCACVLSKIRQFVRYHSLKLPCTTSLFVSNFCVMLPVIFTTVWVIIAGLW